MYNGGLPTPHTRSAAFGTIIPENVNLDGTIQTLDFLPECVASEWIKK